MCVKTRAKLSLRTLNWAWFHPLFRWFVRVSLFAILSYLSEAKINAKWRGNPDSTRFSDCRRFFVGYLSANVYRKMYLDIFEELFAVCVSASTLPQLFLSTFLERFENGLNCLCVLFFLVWRRIPFFISDIALLAIWIDHIPVQCWFGTWRHHTSWSQLQVCSSELATDSWCTWISLLEGRICRELCNLLIRVSFQSWWCGTSVELLKRWRCGFPISSHCRRNIVV